MIVCLEDFPDPIGVFGSLNSITYIIKEIDFFVVCPVCTRPGKVYFVLILWKFVYNNNENF